mgnify:FL=1
MGKTDKLISRTKTLYRDNPWRGRILLTLAIILLLLVITRVMLAPTIIYSATTWLNNQGIDATIEDVSFRIIGGEFSLINAVGKNESGELFHVDEIGVHWSWRPLAKKTVVVHRIDLKNFKADVQQYTDAIVVAGILIPLGAAPATEQPEEPVDEGPIQWAAELNEVTFQNIESCYEQHLSKHSDAEPRKQLDYCVALSGLKWSGSVGYAVNKSLIDKDPVPVSSEGDFLLSGFSVTDRIQSKSMLFIDETRLNNVRINGLNDISIERVNINLLSALQREDSKHKDIVRLSDLLLSGVSLKNLSNLTLAEISLDSPGLYLVKGKDTWEYESWLPPSNSTNEDTKKSTEAKQSSAQTETGSFKLNLGNIRITKSDFCLNKTDIKQYYCLNLADVNWNGEFNVDASDSEKVSAKGSLTLDTQLVRNRPNQRARTTVAKLPIENIDVKDINNAAIQNVTLTKLAALQRSEKEDDQTVILDAINVKSTNFKDGNDLHISSVIISELGAHASINKDGAFEHDKWLPKDNSANKGEESAAKADKAKDEANKQGQDLNFRLDNFELKTKRPLLFTDSVYSPPLEAGLKTLSLSVQKLDSSKPEQESPFELSTKTTRHGTADIKGVIMPFKERLSFDATGNVDGIDLRAFSNAAKKEIGHIIKSGQLDAELKLLAVDGQLDSVIDLKLQKFNLKAVSKEDAKALDDMFGMPINQSLILLKDKKDTIKLSIPITGDVNNPNFDPTNAIIQATAKATTVTLVTFYTPYGLAYAGGNVLFNMATALNFEPIPFDAGSPEMTSAGKEQLDKLAILLKEKPHLHLTMCGMTNLTDIHKLYSRTKDLKEGEELQLKPKQIEKLETIAQQRQTKAKDYLVNTHAIDHSQLILCTPEYHTDAESVSGVEITI